MCGKTNNKSESVFQDDGVLSQQKGWGGGGGHEAYHLHLYSRYSYSWILSMFGTNDHD